MRWLLYLALLVTACNDDVDVPNGIMPPKQMATVLFDAIRADELTDVRLLQDSTFKNFGKRTALYDTVLQLHKLTKAQFDSNLRFYQGRPDLMRIVLDTLQGRVIADTIIVKRKAPVKVQ